MSAPAVNIVPYRTEQRSCVWKISLKVDTCTVERDACLSYSDDQEVALKWSVLPFSKPTAEVSPLHQGWCLPADAIQLADIHELVWIAGRPVMLL
jgi:hypothetical protein